MIPPLFRFPFRASALAAAAGFSVLMAQGNDVPLNISSWELVTPTSARLVFEERGVEFAAFRIESSVDLSASVGAWVEVTPSSLSALGGGVYQATVPVTAGRDPQFFRVVGESIAGDTDGDGVFNEEEITNGTDPRLADSDADGFSDGVEQDAGTDPNDEEDSPDFSFLPAVSFTLKTEVIEEGGFTHSILLEADKPVFGEVNYSISAVSNASTGGGSASDASVVINTVRFNGGTSASIELAIRDDATVEDIETLVVDLRETLDGSYRTGGIDQHILLIKDNDGFWTATVLRGEAETSFRMWMVEEDGSFSGRIVSDADNPGGEVPAGEWDLSMTRTATSFEAVSEPIPMTSTLLIEAELERRLTLRVAPPADPENPGEFEAYYFQPDRMVGVLIDELVGAEEGSSFLNRQSTDVVVLVRETPTPEEIEIPTDSP